MTSENTEVAGSTEPRPHPGDVSNHHSLPGPIHTVDQAAVLKMLGRQHYRNRLLRYYVHKLRVKMYADAVERLEITEDEAREHYRRAMENFDELMGTDHPGWGESIEAEMAKGFALNG